MTKAYIKNGTVISELIKSCLCDKRVNVKSLLSGDAMALMFAIRAHGYGDEYSPKVTCPSCGNVQEDTCKISEFLVKDLDLEKVNQVGEGENLFAFKLPVTGKVVHFKFFTGEDEDKIIQLVEQRQRKGIKAEESITTRLLYAIVAIQDKDGVMTEDRTFISRFIQAMPARDSLALRKHIDENEPGMDTTRQFTCEKCDYQEVLPTPMGITFLWPGANTK